MKKITKEQIISFKKKLIDEEKAKSTIDQYLRDIFALKKWMINQKLSKKNIIEYKKFLSKHYTTSSVNTKISSINSFFSFLGHQELKIKKIIIQKQIFALSEKELLKEDYLQLLTAAKQKKNKRLYYIIQTICSTGIRVSEIKNITVDAINKGIANITNKGKVRNVFLPEKLCHQLKKYIKQNNIIAGPIFLTRNGLVINRSNIWKEMKSLSFYANVTKSKIYPHNLRHLFARTYYSMQKDVVRLADILGHSNINTTRVYTIESGLVHKKQIQSLNLVD